VGAPIATNRVHFLRLTFRRFIRALHANAAPVTAAIANKSNSSSSLFCFVSVYFFTKEADAVYICLIDR